MPVRARLEKTKPIRRIAARETGFCRRHDGPTEDPLKLLGPSQHYGIEGFKGALNWLSSYWETPVSRTADVIFPVWLCGIQLYNIQLYNTLERIEISEHNHVYIYISIAHWSFSKQCENWASFMYLCIYI